MKTKFILLLFVLTTVLSTFGQDSSKEKIFALGVGIGNENNISNYGLFYSGDLKLQLKNRIYLNPKIEYFRSTGSFENAASFGDRYHRGLFLNCGVSYSFVKSKNLDFSFNMGPSLEIGEEMFLRSSSMHNGEIIDEVYETNQLFRGGLFADLEFSLDTGKIRNTIGIKTYAFGIFPEFLGVVYKIGLKSN